MRRHALRQWPIRAGGQVELPALAPLRREIAEQFGVVGQPSGVERGAAGDLGLEASASPGQPQRQLPEAGGIPVQELADRIEERIGLDQRAVQIDAERARSDQTTRQCRDSGTRRPHGVGETSPAAERLPDKSVESAKQLKVKHGGCVNSGIKYTVKRIQSTWRWLHGMDRSIRLQWLRPHSWESAVLN